MAPAYKILFLSIFLLTGIQLTAQNKIFETKVTLSSTNGTIQSVLEEMEREYSVVFAFDPHKILVDKIVHLSSNQFLIIELLEKLFRFQDVEFKEGKNKIFILPFKNEQIELSGFVYSLDSREILPSSLIIEHNSNKNTYANELGKFNFTLSKGIIDISVFYLGNVRVSKQIDLQRDTLVYFYLPVDNNLDSVIIMSNMKDPNSSGITSGEKVISYIRNTFKGMMGRKDIFENIRMLSGVQSGNEAQGGLYIRGGTPDQNLVLMDGIPMYETSHLGGLSSIFIDDMIRDVELINGGFPARYGGRLSSVLSINLKEGNLNHLNTVFDIGLDAMHFHMDGPLVDKKLSFNFSVRKSLLNETARPILIMQEGFSGLNLDFYDANFKLTYKISDKQKLMLTAYSGRDNFVIARNDRTVNGDDYFEFSDESKIQWGTKLIGLRYQYELSKKVLLEMYINTVDYSRYTRGSYKFLTKAQINRREELDVLTYSSIRDNRAKLDLTIKLGASNTLRTGLGYVEHVNNPVVIQRKEIVDNEINEIENSPKKINSYNYYLYLEDKFSYFNKLDVFAGLHFANYQVEGAMYPSLQPRLVLKWYPVKKFTISGTFSKMQQNMHFLVNPGLGLPSELLVPSTAKIKPQQMTQYSLGLSYFSGNLWRFGVDAFYKKYNSILEFDKPNNLFFDIIIENKPIVYENYDDWESNVEEGDAEVKALEFFLFKKWKKIDIWVSYSLSKHERQFDSLNVGKPFLSKHDRTHDLVIKTKYKWNDNWSFSASWTYGTGNTLSLPLEHYNAIDSTTTTIDVLSDRNNLRLPAFHHLDLSASYQKVVNDYEWRISFGVYNVYNRFNPFYVFLYEDTVKGVFKERKASIYPIIPFVNIRFRI